MTPWLRVHEGDQHLRQGVAAAAFRALRAISLATQLWSTIIESQDMSGGFKKKSRNENEKHRCHADNVAYDCIRNV